MLRTILCGIAALSIIAAAPPSHAKTRKGQVTVEVNLKAPADAKDVHLWIPYPMSDGNQDITNVAVNGNYSASAVYRDFKDGNTALYAEWRGPRKDRTLTYTYTVARREVLTKEFPDKELLFSRAEFKRYLDTSSLGNSEHRVRELASEITMGKTTVLAKAKAVYDWVVDNMRRDPEVKGCGLCEIDRLLVGKGGKCADIHSVFTALARASGVPSREVLGNRLPKGKNGDITKWQHCWAEFYLPGYGWVVVDAADVLKYKVEQQLTPDRVQPLREYFFGGVDENRVAYGSGQYVVLNPPQSGGPLRYFMYPYAEADGKALNEDLYGMNIGYTLSYRESE